MGDWAEVDIYEDNSLTDYELEMLDRCMRCEHWNGEECRSGSDYCDFEERGEYEGVHCKD